MSERVVGPETEISNGRTTKTVLWQVLWFFLLCCEVGEIKDDGLASKSIMNGRDDNPV